MRIIPWAKHFLPISNSFRYLWLKAKCNKTLFYLVRGNNQASKSKHCKINTILVHKLWKRCDMGIVFVASNFHSLAHVNLILFHVVASKNLIVKSFASMRTKSKKINTCFSLYNAISIGKIINLLFDSILVLFI